MQVLKFFKHGLSVIDNPENGDSPGHERCEAVTPSPAVATR